MPLAGELFLLSFHCLPFQNPHGLGFDILFSEAAAQCVELGNRSPQGDPGGRLFILMEQGGRENTGKMLDGEVAIILGASCGMGCSMAELFAREGAEVVMTARGQVIQVCNGAFLSGTE